MSDVKEMSPAEKKAAEKSVKPARVRGSCRVGVTWVCEIKAVRKRLNLTLDEVAAETGISAPTIYQIERGGNASLDTARRLADFFGMTVEELWPRRAEQPEGGDS